MANSCVSCGNQMLPICVERQRGQAQVVSGLGMNVGLCVGVYLRISNVSLPSSARKKKRNVIRLVGTVEQGPDVLRLWVTLL